MQMVQEAISLFQPTTQIVVAEEFSYVEPFEAGLMLWQMVSDNILPHVGGVQEVILGTDQAICEDIFVLCRGIFEPENRIKRVVLTFNPLLLSPFCAQLIILRWRIRASIGDRLIVRAQDVQDWSDADTIGDFWRALCVEFHKKFQVEDNDAMLVGGPVVDYGISIPRSDCLYRQDCAQKQIPYEVKAGLLLVPEDDAALDTYSLLS
jgi:hypothetical protein